MQCNQQGDLVQVSPQKKLDMPVMTLIASSSHMGSI